MDRNTIILENGGTYFLACISKSTPRVPVIHTLIYRGNDKDHGHLFEEVDHKDGTYLCYPDKIGPNILDTKALIDYLLSDPGNPLSTLKSYEYKNI